MADASHWLIKGESDEDRIEAALNTALGMSLVHDVMIAVEARATEDGPYPVSVRAGNGDAGMIECDSFEHAVTTRDRIFQRIKDELAQMPPYGRRRSISVRT